MTAPTITLNDGNEIARLGLGTFGLRGEAGIASIVSGIADAHGVTPTQVVLRWHLQLGAIPIPKSGNPDRQRENLDVFGFELTDAEVASISALESGRLWGADPETHEEF